MAETNEYELEALWWKRVLSAFTNRHDRQEIPYVLGLPRVGDQRATETAHRAWLLTCRDRADAIAEIRILVARRGGGRAVRIVCIVRYGCPQLGVSAKRRESSGRPTRTRVAMRRKPLRTSVGDPC